MFPYIKFILKLYDSFIILIPEKSLFETKILANKRLYYRSEDNLIPKVY